MVMVKKAKKKLIKKKSKIIVPTDGSKDSIQAFRCDDGLKKQLAKLDNKSDFIVKAIWKALKDNKEVTCPVCQGKGIINL